MKPKIGKEEKEFVKKYGVRRTHQLSRLTLELYNNYCDKCKRKSPYQMPCDECLIKTKPILKKMNELKNK